MKNKPTKLQETKTVKLSISMPEDLHERAAVKAKAEGEPNFSLYVRGLIKRDLAGGFAHPKAA